MDQEKREQKEAGATDGKAEDGAMPAAVRGGAWALFRRDADDGGAAFGESLT